MRGVSAGASRGGRHAMITRTQRTTTSFAKPFLLRGVGRVLPPGVYEIATDEEPIEGLSFPAYRRVATVIFVPGQLASSIEMVTIDPVDLKAAEARDAAQGTETDVTDEITRALPIRAV